MADNTISSKYEDMDAVLRDFSHEIEVFSRDMNSSANVILSTVDTIGDNWKDNGYDDFRKNMNGKVSSIRLSLMKCDAIDKKLKEASQKLKIVLQKLREKE